MTLSSVVRMTEMTPELLATKTLAPSVDEPIETIPAGGPATTAFAPPVKVFTVLLLVRITETVPSVLAT